jgi:glycosyltransferase involved in cell wall biosynthesis
MAGSPRVVFLTLYYPPLYSGAALQAITLIRALLARGVDVTVITAYPGRLPPARDDASLAGARIVRVRTPRTQYARELVLGLVAAGRLLTSSDWDLLHLIGPSYAALPPACVARLRGRPVLTKTTLLASATSPPSAGAQLLKRVRRWIYRLSGAVVALSEALEEEVRREAGPGPAVVPLPNGVDPGVFGPGSPAERKEARRGFGIREDEFVIASCGELQVRKRPTTLVKAAGLMKHRPVHVVLAGPSGNDPSYELQLQGAIARCSEGVRITRTGTLASERVRDLLRAADAFTLPSSYEGMPNSLLEAMATGLACVASDIPGSRDVLRHGGGRLVPLDDERALAEALDELASDPDLRDRLGAEARAVVADRFSLESVARRYLAIYGDLMRGSR